MMMLSVNFGQLQAVDANGRQYQTGIYKSAQMGRSDFRYGHFSENLTNAGHCGKSGLHRRHLPHRRGLIQVSQPRMPCYKLAALSLG